MKVALTALWGAGGVLALLATAQFAPAAAQAPQQEDKVTATASGPTKAEACSSSMDKAFNLCMLHGLFNVGHLNCDCTEQAIPGTPIWECVGTAECKK